MTIPINYVDIVAEKLNKNIDFNSRHLYLRRQNKPGIMLRK